MDMENIFTKSVDSYQQEFSDGERASIDIITTASKDRDGEIVLPQGVDLTDYRKNPVVIWGHKHSDGLPVGKNIWIKYDKAKNALIAKTQYAEHAFANDIYEYRKTFPLGVSIGFIAKEWIDKEDFNEVTLKSIGLTNKDVVGVSRIFTKTSLMEYSLVNIPANQDATMLAINKGLISRDEAIEKKYPINDIIMDTIMDTIDSLDDIELKTKAIEIAFEKAEAESLPCDNENECAGDSCSIYKSCNKPIKKSQDEALPCDNENECTGESCSIYKSCNKPIKKESQISILVKQLDELKKEVELLKSEKKEDVKLDRKELSPFEMPEIFKSYFDDIKSHFDNQIKTMNFKEVVKEEPEQKSIEIDKEQLVGLVKQAILGVKKQEEIDLSQITIDALKKAKGQLF